MSRYLEKLAFTAKYELIELADPWQARFIQPVVANSPNYEGLYFSHLPCGASDWEFNWRIRKDAKGASS
jgi:hypothetical protein